MKSSILTIDFLGAIQIRLLPDSNCLTTNDLLKNLLPVKVGGRVPGFSGDVSVRFTPRADRARYVAVRVQYSADGVVWNALPASRLVASADASFTGVIPLMAGPVHIRMRVITIPPSGSGARNVSHITVR